MTTSNKNFKVKNGLEVLGTSATVDGNDILTTASNIEALANVDTTGVADGDAIVFNSATTSWIATAIAGGAQFEISDTAPADPNHGDVWYNSTNGGLFIRIVDVDSSQWVQIGMQGPAGPTGPAGPGLAAGGTSGQIIAKVDGTDYNTEWIDNYTSQVKHLVKAGESLTKGQAVYVSSANGTNMIVSKASNATESTASKTMGIIAQDLTTNAEGFVVTEGLVAGLNTSTATAADPVWLGVDGALIFGSSNKPVAPAHMVFIGIVTRVNSSNGEIFVNIQNGFELEELHDVSITSPTAGELVVRNSANTLWENKTLAEAGVSEVGHTHDDRYYTETETDSLLNAKANLSGASFTGDVNVATKLLVNSSSGDEGGEIFLNKAATNTSITGGVTIDVWQNRLRLFEQGGNARGYYLDITRAADGVSTNINPGMSPVIPSSVTVSSGSATVSSSGLITVSSASDIKLNGIFTSAYRNYEIHYNNASGNPASNVYARFTSGGTDNSVSNYIFTGFYTQTSGYGTWPYSGAANWMQLGYWQNAKLTIFKPNLAEETSGTWDISYGQTRGIGQLGFTGTTVFDGFQISNNFYSGTFRVYGYN